jgi:hypothetical protein
MKSAIPLLVARSVETLATLWQALSALFFESNEPVRPGHRYPHKPKRKNEFYTCYKKSAKVYDIGPESGISAPQTRTWRYLRWVNLFLQRFGFSGVKAQGFHRLRSIAYPGKMVNFR